MNGRRRREKRRKREEESGGGGVIYVGKEGKWGEGKKKGG